MDIKKRVQKKKTVYAVSHKRTSLDFATYLVMQNCTNSNRSAGSGLRTDGTLGYLLLMQN